MVKKYKPAIDKLFWIIWIPLIVLLLVSTIISFSSLIGFMIILFVDIFTLYFMISPLFGYVELRKDSLYIKFGFILKRDIPYAVIRDVIKDRRFITYSMLSLKNAMEHIDIKYNKFDMVTISVVNNDDLIYELKRRINKYDFL